MTKRIPLVLLSLLTLPAATALAQPAPAPAPAPPTPAFELAFSIMDYTLAKPMATRTHSVFVVQSDCGQMDEQVGDHDDSIRACLHPAGMQQELVVEWHTKNAIGKPTASSYSGKQSLLITRGKTYAFGGNRDATLWLQVK
jgi:hypothetical protein